MISGEFRKLVEASGGDCDAEVVSMIGASSSHLFYMRRPGDEGLRSAHGAHQSRHEGQLHSEADALREAVEERERIVGYARGSRPVSNDQRRRNDLKALLDHFRANPQFWNSMTRRQDSVLSGSIDSERLPLARFLAPLPGRVSQRFPADCPELAKLIQSGLFYLSQELGRSEMNYVGFRTVWLLLWPILNDLGLMPAAGKSNSNEGQSQEQLALRAAIQKVIAKSF